MRRRVLFLAPHTDDVELGCGGTLARFIEEDKDIYVCAFSTAEQSLPEGVAPGTLRNEFINAMKNVYKLEDRRVKVFDFPVRKLSYHRQAVLEELIVLKRTIEPEVVFVPSGNDLHQDHQVLHNEVLRAFKEITILGYELPWNHIQFSAQAFVILKEHHLEMKWKSLQEYKTQLQLGRAYFSLDIIKSLARIRGTQVKEEWAEAFEVIRVKI